MRLPDSIRKEGWGWGEIVAQDRSGDFWLGSEDGLARVPRRALDAGGPAASTILDTRAGLGSANVFRLFVDSRDALWISTFSETGRTPSFCRETFEIVETRAGKLQRLHALHYISFLIRYQYT